MKRLFTLALIAIVSIGCGDGGSAPVSTPPADPAPASEEGSSKKEEGSGDKEAMFNVQGLPTLAVHVPGIHCEMCAAGVNETLAKVDGVEDITINVETKTATIAINEAAFNTDAALQALAEASYDDSSLVDESAEAEAPSDAS